MVQLSDAQALQALAALVRAGRFAEAVALGAPLLRRQPRFTALLEILGYAYRGLSRLDEAAQCYRRLLAIEPNHADAHLDLGLTLLAMGRAAQAAACFRRALAIRPDDADATMGLGDALRAQGRLAEATTAYSTAATLQPADAAIHANLGALLQDQGRCDEAEVSCRRALQIRPDIAAIHNTLGNALAGQGRLAEATECYRRAIALAPEYADAHGNLGNALMEQGRPDEAEAAYGRAVALRPDQARLQAGLGAALRDLGRLDEAAAAYDRAVALDPTLAAAQAQRLHLRARMCDWSAAAEAAAATSRLGVSGVPVPPFLLLAAEDAPGRHRARAENWARATCGVEPRPSPSPVTPADGRTRIGYFSADLHEHATLYLMAGVFRAHDRTALAVTAYSYGPDREGPARARLARDVERLVDVAGASDQQIVELARADGLDIAVDLKGWTGQGRSRLFAHRLAPVQISYLGYPGTMGAPFIDYLIADRVVVPPDQRAHYSEKLLWLPDSYQANDDQRPIGEPAATRGDLRLPDDGFVFCCFNNSFKITAAEFDIWMRLLRRVDGAVLWLLGDNPWAQANLRREARARGVDPDRLVFAPRAPAAEHLARHRHADLFLDTFPYNAHTTASDALWAGLPLVTRLGEGFAARVAGSLLRAVGLPDLVTDSAAAYEALAFDLATDPGRLADLRARLAANRRARPLFDTARFTRHLEAAYAAAHHRRRDGLAPVDIEIG